MKIEIDLPDQLPGHGLRLRWENNAEIISQTKDESVTIKANKDGLVSLARHFLTMALTDLPPGYHIHLDESNGLEPGSCELILEKM